MYNIDDSAALTPEEQEAYNRALQRAIAENRSINIYDVKGYRDPKRREKHLQEQHNIMRLGIPATTSLWEELDPAFEISNKTPFGRLALGEVYGGFNPNTDKEYGAGYGPTIGLNYDAIGNKTLMEMKENESPESDYKSRYAANVYDTMKHEREHTYMWNRIPFGYPEEVVTKYFKENPQEANKIKSTVENFLINLSNTEPMLASLYMEAIKKDPSKILSLFEEMSARTIEDGTASKEIQRYSNWKKTGLFE